MAVPVAALVISILLNERGELKDAMSKVREFGYDSTRAALVTLRENVVS